MIEAREQSVVVERLRLACAGRSDSCDLSKWKVMAGKLDWSVVAGHADFSVLAEDEDESVFELVKVSVGCGNHTVSVSYADGRVVERVIPASQVVATVRLFVSCLVRRKKLVVRFKDFEQLGTVMTDHPPTMVIQPV